MGGTPQSHPAEYDASSVMTHVAGVQGALMLVHGLVDENVHFRHTARLAQVARLPRGPRPPPRPLIRKIG
jgi:dipeptidyl-peptidase-4